MNPGNEPPKAICHEICRRPGRTKPGNVSQSCRGVQMVKKSNLVSKLVAPIFCGGGGFVLRLGAPHGRASPSPPPAWSSAGAASRDGGINPAPPLASPTPPVTGALTDLQPSRRAARREENGGPVGAAAGARRHWLAAWHREQSSAAQMAEGAAGAAGSRWPLRLWDSVGR